MIRVLRKAGIVTCLFLCFTYACPHATATDLPAAEGEQWTFTPLTQRAYDMVFTLDLNGVHSLIPDPTTPDEIYVVSLAETVELLLEEDGEKYSEYETRFESRRDRRTRWGSPADVFIQAEMSIQWAFVHYKFGHEFDAALNLRDAYSITTQARKRHPHYEALKKTAAVLEVIVGSVPEKYNWVLSLLGITGSVGDGLALFESLHASSSQLKREAELMHALVRCYVLQQSAEASALLDELTRTYPSPLTSFLRASVAIKNAENEKALPILQALDTLRTFRLDYASYLLGEVFLCRGNYLQSIAAFRQFLQHYQGQNNIKDAYYKIGMCYWLNGNTNDAQEAFRMARNAGREVTEADKHAARSLTEDEPPHRQLTQARYATDGGYYDQARRTLDNISAELLKTKRDEVEYHYRYARLDHRTGKFEAAKKNYETVIHLNGNANWYFAPNACLQIGYILLQQHKSKEAEAFFQRALSYKKHEYKNSIDTKARSALAQLKRR